jgi:fructose-specific phosphotransferase system component IIB
MYSVADLAKMFKTTRKTIYTKLDTESIQEYIKETKQGKRLLEEGLTQFQLIMADSKVLQDKQNSKQDTIQQSNDYYTTHIQDYINQLKSEIDELKKDKEYFRIHLNNSQEMLKARDNLLENMNQQILLLQEPKKEKKHWWQFWKN